MASYASFIEQPTKSFTVFEQCFVAQMQNPFERLYQRKAGPLSLGNEHCGKLYRFYREYHD